MTHGHGLAVLRILIGIFLLFEGIDKLPWLLDSSILAGRLAGYLASATPLNRPDLELMIPGIDVFARLVVLGELAAGLALIVGVLTRTAAALSLVMVLNFHVASGAIFVYALLTNGYGLPVVGSLLALALAARKLPWSLRP